MPLCHLLAPDSNMTSGMAPISRERPIQHRQMDSSDTGLRVGLSFVLDDHFENIDRSPVMMMMMMEHKTNLIRNLLHHK